MADPLRLLQYPAALCNQVRRVAIAAGDAIMDHFDESGFHAADHKDDGSPVTIADREAEAIILSGLKDILQGVPMVGEESAAAGVVPDLGARDLFWIVDPLDGTRSFVQGSKDFTVNIALVRDGVPFLGVVYAPALGELYAGYGEGTAIKWNEDTETEKNISVRQPPRGGLTILRGKHHSDAQSFDDFVAGFKVEKVLKRGSSVKICAIAAGKADLYPRFGSTYEWDTAAAEAVLRSAGGTLVDMSGSPLVYGGVERGFLNPSFIAASGAFDLFPPEELTAF